MFLLIHCLRHLLLLTARIESVHHKDANHDHDSEHCHAHFLTDACRCRRVRMQLQTRRRFHWLSEVAHGCTPASAALGAGWACGFCPGAFPPPTSALRIKSTFV